MNVGITLLNLSGSNVNYCYVVFDALDAADGATKLATVGTREIIQGLEKLERIISFTTETPIYRLDVVSDIASGAIAGLLCCAFPEGCGLMPKGGFISGNSANVTPSPRLHRFCPMTMYVNSVGTVTYNSATSTSASTDTANDWISGFSSFSWLVAGTAIKMRASTTMPTGVSATTTYYAGKLLRIVFASASKGGCTCGQWQLCGHYCGWIWNVHGLPCVCKSWSGRGTTCLSAIRLRIRQHMRMCRIFWNVIGITTLLRRA